MAQSKKKIQSESWFTAHRKYLQDPVLTKLPPPFQAAENPRCAVNSFLERSVCLHVVG